MEKKENTNNKLFWKCAPRLFYSVYLFRLWIPCSCIVFVRLFSIALENYHRKRDTMKIAHLFFLHLSNVQSVYRSSDCSFAFETKRKSYRCGIARILFHSMLKLNRKRSIGKRDREEGLKEENQKSVEPFGQVASKCQWIPYIGNGSAHTHITLLFSSPIIVLCVRLRMNY